MIKVVCVRYSLSKKDKNKMFIIEIIAMLFSLVCIWLYTKQNNWSWPVGIIGTIGYLIIFSILGLPGQIILQSLFLIQGFYGWYCWKYGRSKEDFKPSYLTWQQRILSLLGIGAGTFIFSFFDIGALPFLDGFGASLSIMAMFLLAKKKMENWYLWMIANIIMIVICILSGLWVSIGFYVIAYILDIKGIIEWKKDM